MFVNPDSAVADRRLSQKSDLYNGFGGKVEVSHHIKVRAVRRVVKCKVVSDPANLKPSGVAV